MEEKKTEVAETQTKTEEKVTKPNKFWYKIINKTKEGVLIIPPHKSGEKLEPTSYSWDDFNRLFEFDETDKTKCYSIYDDPKYSSNKDESKYKTDFKKKKPFNKRFNKKDDKNEDDVDVNELKKIKKEQKRKSMEKIEALRAGSKKRAKLRPNTSVDEYTMSIGDMLAANGIKLSSPQK